MPFDFASAKLALRRTVHLTFGVPAFYRDSVDTVEAPIRARWHDKEVLAGELDNDGYAEAVETTNKLIFQPDLHAGLVLRKNGIVRFPSLGDLEFVLVLLEPSDGPPNVTWQVNRVKQ